MIIHRAFIREVLQTSSAVLAVLMSIFLVVRVIDVLREAAEGDIPLNGVFILLLLHIVESMDIIIPLVLFISVLLVFARWIRDNELIVVNACGIGMSSFLKPLAVLFLIVGSLAAALSFYLRPLAIQVTRTIEYEFRQRSDVAGIVPGVFTETRNGNGVYFVEGYDEETDQFQDVFVYSAEDDSEGLVVANVAFKTVDERTNDDFLVLKEGSRYEGSPGSSEYAIIDFETYAIRLKQRAKSGLRLPVKAYPTARLIGSKHRAAIGELNWRLAKVVGIPILLLYAVAFSSITYRRSRFPSMVGALLIYFAYSNTLGFAFALIRRGELSPHFGLWLVHGAFLALALFFFYRRSYNKRLIPGLPA
ncbi:MAG: LPS export ABC transporter permease LptF [Pseudomonadota bacterium]|nr:LPS export ABC transporter permease LptF [Pseudomonadota bacterium]